LENKANSIKAIGQAFAVAAAAAIVGTVPLKAAARQATGAPGSPSATASISNTHLQPFPSCATPKFTTCGINNESNYYWIASPPEGQS
jgi:hypothetical protein